MLPTFYMSDSSVPATGLYYYTTRKIKGSEMLQEYVIGFDGKPTKPSQRAELKTRPKKDTVSQLKLSMRGEEQDLLEEQNWMLEVPDAPGTYLTLFPIGQPFPERIWTDMLKKHRHQPQTYILSPIARLSMIAILEDRYRTGYDLVSIRAAKNPNLQIMVANSTPFWNCLKQVGRGLIEAIKAHFDGTYEKRNQSTFVNPDLVFHLNRVLCEGFITGHVQDGLTDSRYFSGNDASINAWHTMLSRTKETKDILSFKNLTQEERIILDIIEKHAIREARDTIPFVGGYISQRLFDLALEEIFNFITPGTTEQQVLVFWGMHYPHWFKDLYYVLQEFAKYNIFLHRKDITAIAGIISTALKGTLDDQTTRTIANLTDVTGRILINPDPIRQIVEGVFTELRKDAVSSRRPTYKPIF